MNARRQEQRKNGFMDDIVKLAGILVKHPDESTHVSAVYATTTGGPSPWWRVTVQIGTDSVFRPRFEAFDDAAAFRLRAAEMASAG